MNRAKATRSVWSGKISRAPQRTGTADRPAADAFINPVDITGTDIVRVVEGKITEIYHVEELLKLTQQISTGAQPA
ncbi:hypothetical protein [Streptomyces coeruleofuscus]|uniref:hypothetical protein n=1 Tax=Streptomyces coeruleofuscus TaxID=66879 RepID=UPI0031F7DBED